MPKPKIEAIAPKVYPADDVRRELYNAVDCVANNPSPCIGYAFVSFHKNKRFHAYYNTNKMDISAVDIPDMVKARLQAVMIKALD